MYRLITLLLILGLIQISKAQTNDLTVQISGLRSNSGKCLISLYNGKSGFPTDPESALSTSTALIKDRKCVVVMKNIPPGEYAIAIVHDENSNGKLDSNFLGIPKEGIGISNNAKSLIGPPDFEDSRFTFGKNKNSVNIIINYL
jgi:uncharacterized protein (DUF2141 family)